MLGDVGAQDFELLKPHAYANCIPHGTSWFRPNIVENFQILWLGLLKILSGSVDTNPRLLKAMRDWDWRPLLKALKLHESMPLFGGNAASVHAATALKFLLGEGPQAEEGQSTADKATIQFAQDAVVDAGGIDVLVNVSATFMIPVVCSL